MKIHPYTQVSHQMYRQNSERTEDIQIAGKHQKRDQIEISKEAQDMQKGTPIEIEREQRVEAIKKKVEEGTYRVDPKAVAHKLYDFWNE